jgi:hypothetical protein
VQLYTVLLQGTGTICIDQSPCFQKSAYYLGKTVYYLVSSFVNIKAQFKVSLKTYLHTHTFYSVESSKCLKMSYKCCKGFLPLKSVTFLLYVYVKSLSYFGTCTCSVVFIYMVCIFMTYSASCCHPTKLWIHGMYIYMYECMFHVLIVVVVRHHFMFWCTYH